MNEPPLAVLVPYGRQAGSSRVRVYEWIERTGVAASVANFIGQGGANPRLLTRHLLAVTLAERRLRRIANGRPHRLLIQREASPLSSGSLERKLLGSADFSIYDIDDALPWEGGWDFQGRVRAKAPKSITACAAADRVDRRE